MHDLLRSCNNLEHRSYNILSLSVPQLSNSTIFVHDTIDILKLKFLMLINNLNEFTAPLLRWIRAWIHPALG